MPKIHKIIYIDERKQDRDKFLRKFDSYFEVEAWSPKSDLRVFVEILLKNNFDAVVTDHRLTEYREDGADEVDYEGVDLVKEFKKFRKDYPCFILTSYDDDAIADVDDVNSVYSKKSLDLDDTKSPLHERIRMQIEHYQAKINKAKIRLKELLDKYDKAKLSSDEENELLSLDSFLESNICNWASIPKEKKNNIAISKVVELLDTTRSLLDNLKEEK